jgi:hypothetical protein
VAARVLTDQFFCGLGKYGQYFKSASLNRDIYARCPQPSPERSSTNRLMGRDPTTADTRRPFFRIFHIILGVRGRGNQP